MVAPVPDNGAIRYLKVVRASRVDVDQKLLTPGSHRGPNAPTVTRDPDTHGTNDPDPSNTTITSAHSLPSCFYHLIVKQLSIRIGFLQRVHAIIFFPKPTNQN